MEACLRWRVSSVAFVFHEKLCTGSAIEMRQIEALHEQRISEISMRLFDQIRS
jgi:hypothetical protein